MKYMIAMLVVLIVPFVSANVMITEVMYNPETSESDTEYVEIYNQGDTDVDISGWSLHTASEQALLPEGTVIGANKSFLIADEDDNGVWPVSWPEPDYNLEEISLTNSNSGIQLLDSEGVIVDVVGWGDPVPELYEGTPHPGVSEGESLTRKSTDELYTDTDDNSQDFIAAAPSPKNSKTSQENDAVIVLQAVVTGNPPIIGQVTITPDEHTDEGVQVMPNPGATKTVTIQAIITDMDQDLDTVTVNKIDMSLANQINETSAIYQADLVMEFYDPAGAYSVEVLAQDASGGVTAYNSSFEYLELAAFEIDTDSVLFSGVPGLFHEILGDLNFSTANPTVKNLGNVILDFAMSGSDLESDFDTILAENVMYTFLDNDFNSNVAGTLSYTPVQVPVNLQPNMLRELTLAINFPTGISVGEYYGDLYITGVAS